MSASQSPRKARHLAGWLRNTALEVRQREQGSGDESDPTGQQRCLELVQAFEAALKADHVAADVRYDALYALCGLLDEAIPARLPASVRSRWEAHPLQVQCLGQHDAGEQVYDRLALRMLEASPNVELLQCYATVLDLGFKGRHAREGGPQRAAVRESLQKMLARSAPQGDDTLVVVAAQGHRRGGLRRVSPWTVAGLTCIAAALAFYSSKQLLG